MIKVFDLLSKIHPETTNVKVALYEAYKSPKTLYTGPVCDAEEALAFNEYLQDNDIYINDRGVMRVDVSSNKITITVY